MTRMRFGGRARASSARAFIVNLHPPDPHRQLPGPTERTFFVRSWKESPIGMATSGRVKVVIFGAAPVLPTRDTEIFTESPASIFN